MGRKTTGLRPKCSGYGSRVAGRAAVPPIGCVFRTAPYRRYSHAIVLYPSTVGTCLGAVPWARSAGGFEAPVAAGQVQLSGQYDFWQFPEETEHLGRGDCEDKAIWLYAKMLAEGFDDVRLVLGKYIESDTVFHAWVVWYPQIKRVSQS